MIPDISAESAKIAAEAREIGLLVESTRTEISRLRLREDQARTGLDQVRGRSAEVSAAADEYAACLERRMTMESELSGLEAKRKLLDRIASLTAAASRTQSVADVTTSAEPGVGRFGLDENRLLQAVVDTQEEERRRIARRVHDGPAQAMANVVLQSEISERLFDIDPERSRHELAALRQTVSRTLQELRGFIFELRPMILDDLGLVPTLRRYIQTLVDKHEINIDFASNGRDLRLPPDDEVAIFRLIQDSVIERIEQAGAHDVRLALSWEEDSLGISLRSDGRVLPRDGELGSGLRRSERLELLGGELGQESTVGQESVLDLQVPIRPAPLLIT